MSTTRTWLGLTYTPTSQTLTWAQLHDELRSLAGGELSLEAIDSLLRLAAEDGELLAVTVGCGLAGVLSRADGRPCAGALL